MTSAASPGRFVLDETRALAVLEWWIGDSEHASRPEPEEQWIPDLPTGWRANYDDDGTGTAGLVDSAQEAGVLALPEGCDHLAWLFDAGVGDGDWYRWLLCMTGPSGLLLASDATPMSLLGGGDDCRGAEAAMEVLREAERAGNDMLRRLAYFVKAATR